VKEYVNILPNQSLFDIAIIYYGTPEAIVAIAQANNMSITDTITPGTMIQLPEGAPTNADIAQYYKQHGLQPATAQLSAEIEDICLGEDWSIDGEGVPGPPIVVFPPQFTEEFF